MTVDGITLYGAGDTNYYPEMESFNDLDYALLPVDGIYNMSAQEASRCAHVIDSRYFIPIHTSPTQLYDEDIASFKTGDLYDHHDAEGFITLYGLSTKVRAMKLNNKK